MTKQPEALELADSLCSRYDLFPKSDEFKAAAELRRQDGEINSMRSEPIGTEKELRRLHEVNAELLGLVKLVHGSFAGGLVMTFSDRDVVDFENAIDKAEQTDEAKLS
jgi:hypothetical protein